MSFQQQPQAAAAKKDRRSAQVKAQGKAGERDLAMDEMRALEAGDAPTTLEGWPSGPAKFLTYGNEDDGPYGVGVTAKLGPSDLRRYADGSVSIGGEKVDNPEDYKGKPLPGGPTDPASH